MKNVECKEGAGMMACDVVRGGVGGLIFHQNHRLD